MLGLLRTRDSRACSDGKIANMVFLVPLCTACAGDARRKVKPKDMARVRVDLSPRYVRIMLRNNFTRIQGLLTEKLCKDQARSVADIADEAVRDKHEPDDGCMSRSLTFGTFKARSPTSAVALDFDDKLRKLVEAHVRAGLPPNKFVHCLCTGGASLILGFSSIVVA